jgi:hypothetical protein
VVVAVVVAVVVGGAVVGGSVVGGVVVAGTVVPETWVVGVNAIVTCGTVSLEAGVVVSVVDTLVGRWVVVVDSSAAIGIVVLTGVLVETLESVRARPKRNAPTATVTTSVATSNVATA